MEKNNRLVKTRDLYKKLGEIIGKFNIRMGMVKDKNGRELINEEKIKERWREYVEDLYKKEPNGNEKFLPEVTELEPDILEREIEMALEDIASNKASGYDGIPFELTKKVNGKTVKVLHSICQQIWKSQSLPKDWKKSVYFLIPKKGNAKYCTNYRTITLIPNASKDYSKAFDCVDHDTLWSTLEELGTKTLYRIRNLYVN
ncbi:hypothetical protein J437_LFUL000991 [Ladona fulva]|uniref:Reverse transcriptase n=1 Tax=Ladona fulva TaxID=123851 RepID=A0A8K0KH34_LADFU|nr:hypothetical protein J437_LFUL000991 [Ladona fulva]